MSSSVLIFGDRHYVPDQNNPDNRFRFSIENKTDKMVIQYTRNGGKTWKAMASETPSNISDGWISVSSGNSLRWVPFSGINMVGQVGGNTGIGSYSFWIDFMHPGDIVDRSMFGAFTSSMGPILIRGLQVSCFSPPSLGEVVKVSIANSTNESMLYCPLVSVGSGIITEAIFDSPHYVPKNTTIRAIANVTGTSTASFITVRALIEKE